ncbi:unnamed protein product [Gadus morhua 'NCC']
MVGSTLDVPSRLTVARTFIDRSAITDLETVTVSLSALFHSRETPVHPHRSFRSGQSEFTPNPGALVSSLPLGFFLNPRKLGGSLVFGTLRRSRSRMSKALAISLTA